MANDRKDSNEYSNLSDDIQRDNSAKEGPSTPLGSPDNDPSISRPYSSDTQTQLAAKSTENKNKNNNDKNDNTSGM